MWSWLFVLSLVSSSVWAQVDIAAVSRGKKCPITRVDRFEYTCQVPGWVRNPSLLKVVRQVDADAACAQSCLDIVECRAFRFQQEKKTCQLYSKRLEDMYTAFDNFQPGVLYDRYCFSTDCNTILTCKTHPKCETASTIAGARYYASFERYACTYGFTSRSYGEKYTEVLLKGSLPVCQAVDACVDAFKTGSCVVIGSIDLHFHRSSKQWVCRLYQETAEPYLEGDMLRDLQHVIPERFSVANASVGAAYGYWIERGDPYD